MLSEINPPDYETRMAILKKRCELKNENLSDEILDYIATNVNSNIRELEGAYKKVTALNKLVNVNTEATLDIAKNALKDIINPNTKNVITIDSIIDVVASHYELSIDQLCSTNRCFISVVSAIITSSGSSDSFVTKTGVSSEYPAFSIACTF